MQYKRVQALGIIMHISTFAKLTTLPGGIAHSTLRPFEPHREGYNTEESRSAAVTKCRTWRDANRIPVYTLCLYLKVQSIRKASKSSFGVIQPPASLMVSWLQSMMEVKVASQNLEARPNSVFSWKSAVVVHL